MMTRLLVLGMLYKQDLSGYDIQNMLKMTDAERWGGVLSGSIYHAIRKMEQDGYITLSSIESTGLRQRALYMITAAGRDYFKSLLKESINKLSISYPTTIYSALSFCNMIDKEEVLDALKIQRNKLLDEKEILMKGFSEKKEAMNHLPEITVAIFDNMFGLIENQLKFVNAVIEIYQ